MLGGFFSQLPNYEAYILQPFEVFLLFLMVVCVCVCGGGCYLSQHEGIPRG